MSDKPFFVELIFERLLNRGHYGIFDNQVIFYNHELGKFVITQISEEQEYTAEHYALLPENAPLELLNGKLIFMPSPKTNHQRVSMRLIRFLDRYIADNNLGELFHAPYDVHFDDENIMQPDLLYVSISRKAIIEDYIKGAPDFVVEVLSPGNTKAEMESKMELYGKYDVLEYWIVKPKELSVEVYHNQEQTMHLHQEAGMDDTIKSVAIEGFELEVKRIFE